MLYLNGEAKEEIIRRIEFLRSELEDLKSVKTDNLASLHRAGIRDVERIVENIANASIDIAKILLAGYDAQMPSSYREVFLELQKRDIIDDKISEQMTHLVRTRNVLAHQYLNLGMEMINRFADEGIVSVENFLKTAGDIVSM